MFIPDAVCILPPSGPDMTAKTAFALCTCAAYFSSKTLQNGGLHENQSCCCT